MSSYTEYAASGLPNPTHLEGGKYDLSRLKVLLPHVVRDSYRVLTLLLDVQ